MKSQLSISEDLTFELKHFDSICCSDTQKYNFQISGCQQIFDLSQNQEIKSNESSNNTKIMHFSQNNNIDNCSLNFENVYNIDILSDLNSPNNDSNLIQENISKETIQSNYSDSNGDLANQENNFFEISDLIVLFRADLNQSVYFDFSPFTSIASPFMNQTILEETHSIEVHQPKDSYKRTDFELSNHSSFHIKLQNPTSIQNFDPFYISNESSDILKPELQITTSQPFMINDVPSIDANSNTNLIELAHSNSQCYENTELHSNNTFQLINQIDVEPNTQKSPISVSNLVEFRSSDIPLHHINRSASLNDMSFDLMPNQKDLDISQSNHNLSIEHSEVIFDVSNHENPLTELRLCELNSFEYDSGADDNSSENDEQEKAFLVISEANSTNQVENVQFQPSPIVSTLSLDFDHLSNSDVIQSNKSTLKYDNHSEIFDLPPNSLFKVTSDALSFELPHKPDNEIEFRQEQPNKISKMAKFEKSQPDVLANFHLKEQTKEILIMSNSFSYETPSREQPDIISTNQQQSENQNYNAIIDENSIQEKETQSKDDSTSLNSNLLKYHMATIPPIYVSTIPIDLSTLENSEILNSDIFAQPENNSIQNEISQSIQLTVNENTSYAVINTQQVLEQSQPIYNTSQSNLESIPKEIQEFPDVSIHEQNGKDLNLGISFQYEQNEIGSKHELELSQIESINSAINDYPSTSSKDINLDINNNFQYENGEIDTRNDFELSRIVSIHTTNNSANKNDLHLDINGSFQYEKNEIDSKHKLQLSEIETINRDDQSLTNPVDINLDINDSFQYEKNEVDSQTEFKLSQIETIQNKIQDDQLNFEIKSFSIDITHNSNQQNKNEISQILSFEVDNNAKNSNSYSIYKPNIIYINNDIKQSRKPIQERFEYQQANPISLESQISFQFDQLSENNSLQSDSLMIDKDKLIVDNLLIKEMNQNQIKFEQSEFNSISQNNLSNQTNSIHNDSFSIEGSSSNQKVDLSISSTENYQNNLTIPKFECSSYEITEIKENQDKHSSSNSLIETICLFDNFNENGDITINEIQQKHVDLNEKPELNIQFDLNEPETFVSIQNRNFNCNIQQQPALDFEFNQSQLNASEITELNNQNLADNSVQTELNNQNEVQSFKNNPNEIQKHKMEIESSQIYENNESSKPKPAFGLSQLLNIIEVGNSLEYKIDQQFQFENHQELYSQQPKQNEIDFTQSPTISFALSDQTDLIPENNSIPINQNKFSIEKLNEFEISFNELNYPIQNQEEKALSFSEDIIFHSNNSLNAVEYKESDPATLISIHNKDLLPKKFEVNQQSIFASNHSSYDRKDKIKFNESDPLDLISIQESEVTTQKSVNIVENTILTENDAIEYNESEPLTLISIQENQETKEKKFDLIKQSIFNSEGHLFIEKYRSIQCNESDPITLISIQDNENSMQKSKAIQLVETENQPTKEEVIEYNESPPITLISIQDNADTNRAFELIEQPIFNSNDCIENEANEIKKEEIIKYNESDPLTLISIQNNEEIQRKFELTKQPIFNTNDSTKNPTIEYNESNPITLISIQNIEETPKRKFELNAQSIFNINSTNSPAQVKSIECNEGDPLTLISIQNNEETNRKALDLTEKTLDNANETKSFGQLTIQYNESEPITLVSINNNDENLQAKFELNEQTIFNAISYEPVQSIAYNESDPITLISIQNNEENNRRTLDLTEETLDNSNETNSFGKPTTQYNQSEPITLVSIQENDETDTKRFELTNQSIFESNQAISSDSKIECNESEPVTLISIQENEGPTHESINLTQPTILTENNTIKYHESEPITLISIQENDDFEKRNIDLTKEAVLNQNDEQHIQKSLDITEQTIFHSNQDNSLGNEIIQYAESDPITLISINNPNDLTETLNHASTKNFNTCSNLIFTSDESNINKNLIEFNQSDAVVFYLNQNSQSKENNQLGLIQQTVFTSNEPDSNKYKESDPITLISLNNDEHSTISTHLDISNAISMFINDDSNQINDLPVFATSEMNILSNIQNDLLTKPQTGAVSSTEDKQIDSNEIKNQIQVSDILSIEPSSMQNLFQISQPTDFESKRNISMTQVHGGFSILPQDNIQLKANTLSHSEINSVDLPLTEDNQLIGKDNPQLKEIDSLTNSNEILNKQKNFSIVFGSMSIDLANHKIELDENAKFEFSQINENRINLEESESLSFNFLESQRRPYETIFGSFQIDGFNSVDTLSTPINENENRILPILDESTANSFEIQLAPQTPLVTQNNMNYDSPESDTKSNLVLWKSFSRTNIFPNTMQRKSNSLSIDKINTFEIDTPDNQRKANESIDTTHFNSQNELPSDSTNSHLIRRQFSIDEMTSFYINNIDLNYPKQLNSSSIEISHSPEMNNQSQLNSFTISTTNLFEINNQIKENDSNEMIDRNQSVDVKIKNYSFQTVNIFDNPFKPKPELEFLPINSIIIDQLNPPKPKLSLTLIDSISYYFEDDEHQVELPIKNHPTSDSEMQKVNLEISVDNNFESASNIDLQTATSQAFQFISSDLFNQIDSNQNEGLNLTFDNNSLNQSLVSFENMNLNTNHSNFSIENSSFSIDSNSINDIVKSPLIIDNQVDLYNGMILDDDLIEVDNQQLSPKIDIFKILIGRQMSQIKQLERENLRKEVEYSSLASKYEQFKESAKESLLKRIEENRKLNDMNVKLKTQIESISSLHSSKNLALKERMIQKNANFTIDTKNEIFSMKPTLVVTRRVSPKNILTTFTIEHIENSTNTKLSRLFISNATSFDCLNLIGKFSHLRKIGKITQCSISPKYPFITRKIETTFDLERKEMKPNLTFSFHHMRVSRPKYFTNLHLEDNLTVAHIIPSKSQTNSDIMNKGQITRNIERSQFYISNDTHHVDIGIENDAFVQPNTIAKPNLYISPGSESLEKIWTNPTLSIRKTQSISIATQKRQAKTT